MAQATGAVTSPGPKTDVSKALLGGGTYRGLDQQRLSPLEERVEKIRRVSGFFLAPIGFLAMWFLPQGMEGTQQKVASVLIGVILLWLCESIPIPVTALLGVAMMVLVGVAPASDVLAPFGSSTIFTFIGAFILAQAMLKQALRS